MSVLQETNDPALRSWVEVPPGSDFPIQNLPFGIFEQHGVVRAGVAIGEHIVDLAFLQERGYLDEAGLSPGIFRDSVLNSFLALGRGKIRHVRALVSQLLRRENETLKGHEGDRQSAIVRKGEVTMLLPVRIGNYTDFYSSEEHALNVGSMFRDPANALLPNWKHLPVGYHGRASSIVVSGTEIRRPCGQVKTSGNSLPAFGPTKKLDFELELAFVTCAESALGKPIPIDQTADYIAGFVLFNDWSARDIQQWEYVPLGPFLGKNFASTISPWIVTLDALEPFRVAGPVQKPDVLPYLASHGARNFDITLQVCLQPEGQDEVTLCRTNAKYLYWNVDQQLAHHTVNGCNVMVGDLYASGTISGPSPGSYGSMLELSWNGSKPLKIPGAGSRTFLEDFDTVIMTAHAEANGVRVGFGSCVGKILPSQ